MKKIFKNTSFDDVFAFTFIAWGVLAVLYLFSKYITLLS